MRRIVLKSILLAALTSFAVNAWGQEYDQNADVFKDRNSASDDRNNDNPDGLKAQRDFGRHHIYVGFPGVYRVFNNALKFPEMDARWALAGNGGYLYSFSKRWGIALNVDFWGYNYREAPSGDYTLDGVVGYLGLGCRYNIRTKSHKLTPFLQAEICRTALIISKMDNRPLSRTKYIWERLGEGFGGCLKGGADLRLGKLVSIPAEIHYFMANPATSYTVFSDTTFIKVKENFDLSGIGFSVGIAFHLGKIEK